MLTMFRHTLLAGFLVAAVVTSTSLTALAQTAPQPAMQENTGRLTGTINDQTANPASGVEVTVRGPATRTVVTDASGTFTIDGLPPGIYTVNVTKAGFTPTRGDATVVAGSITTATLQLTAASLSSIQTIGRVSTSSARNALNTSTASVASISGNDFVDQGQLNVTRALNELPGVQIGLTTDFYSTGLYNGASPVATGVPMIRGALPYETESLIDGHPITIGLFGTFNPAFINPNILQDVEVAKGPGASATNIFNAIGGTINFRTLEPTTKPHESFDVGMDQFGGLNGNVRATGTFGKLGYAFDAASQGTKGYVRGFNPLDPIVSFAPGDLINGQVACGNPAATGCNLGVYNPPDTRYIGNPNYQNAVDFITPFFACCQQVPMGSNSRNELGKLRYNFTPSTSLTFTYVGGQLRADIAGADGYTLPDYYFAAPAGYTGSFPTLTPLPVDLQGPGQDDTNVNLFAADFRTTLGPATINARYYIASDSDIAGRGLSDNSPWSVNEQLYGGLPLGNDLTPTLFNGQVATITEINTLSDQIEQDKLYGLTVQATAPVGNNVFSLSYDSVRTKSFATTQAALFDNVTLFPGSGQAFQTVAAQGQFQLTPALQANVANYATLYSNHFTQDLGTTFQTSTHAYDVPRASLAWRASKDVAVRASTGFSITAPYLSLLENSLPQPAQFPILYGQVTNNAGSVRPETAFGWDLGADVRTGRDSVASADVYETTLHDQFLTTTSLSPTPFVLGPGNPYNDTPGSYPLYVTQAQNIGHSKYEGIEFSIHHDPLYGLGYKFQGSLQRAYVYDLPAGFYDTAAGPNTTNLAILPNINFTTSGDGYNGIGFSRAPYSQGYAEMNYRLRSGAYFLLGATYYGSNNSYNEPAFAVVNGSYRQPLGKHASLLLSVTNITSAYPYFLSNDFGGIPVPLVNGKIGYDPANVVGPSNASLTFHYDF
jgi:Carboxypeptidase regulatory-like domain/TonB dependent receptor/TonB-dependent Receptor Plug Domain